METRSDIYFFGFDLFFKIFQLQEIKKMQENANLQSWGNKQLLEI